MVVVGFVRCLRFRSVPFAKQETPAAMQPCLQQSMVTHTPSPTPVTQKLCLDIQDKPA